MNPSSQPSIATRPSTSPRIMVVDDDPLMRLHARTVLEKAGHDVVEIASGEQALEAIDSESVDGILLDLTMPGMNGFETCAGLRERLKEDTLPIVIMTGNEDLGSIERSFTSGATDFVTKPVNWTILKQRLGDLVRSRHVARELQTSEVGRRALLDTVPDTILRVDRDGALHEIKVAQQATAFDRRLLQDNGLFDALPEASRKLARTVLDGTLDGRGENSFEFEIAESEETRHYEVRMVACGDDQATLMVRDFTERRRAEARIRELAYQDALTGLPNAAALQETLLERDDQTLLPDALVRIGLNDLSQVESVFGHKVKSSVVREVARRLELALHEASPRGGLLARTHDGEFALLMPLLKQDGGIETVLDRAERTFEPVFEIDGYELRISASLGVARSPDNGYGMELLDRAGSALDEARRDPINRRRFYSQTSHTRALKSAELEGRLRRAIEGDEIQLVYQPKFATADNRIVGVEALARWVNPELGPVSPGEFIPLAERCGLILPLGEKIIDLACRQALTWRGHDMPSTPIAVNFSGHQFSRPDVVESLKENLLRHGVHSHEIEVEITETAAVADTKLVKRLLGELKELGVQVAIDDFGTGFSSLGMLRSLPFDTLKIDRCFVKDIGEDASADAITASIIGMGHALGMKIVAEGVETEAQRAFLKHHHCDILQGYLLGRPVAATELFRD